MGKPKEGGEETRVSGTKIEAELQRICPNMYAINKNLQQGLWSEHWTAAASTEPWDTYNLACIEDRQKEFLEEHKILAIDTENQGVIVCIGTVG